MLTYIMTRNYQIKHALCVGPMSYLILLLKTFPKCALNNTIYMFRKPQGSYNESWKLHNRMKIVRINGKKKKKIENPFYLKYVIKNGVFNNRFTTN